MQLLSLGDDLGIEASVDLKHSLTDGLAQPAPLQLDGGNATRVHTASLQLLCALFQHRREAGLQTQWAAASPILRDAARLLGLTAVLGLGDDSISSTSPPHHTHHQDMEIAA